MRQRRPHRGRQKRPSRSERARKPAQAAKRAERGIEIILPSRVDEPERVVAHLGPTNSGKTYAALEELAAAGSGVYAGPLRMLAQEAHRRLGERMGAEKVGLVTGEERINERAPVIASTVEMAPQSGELLVLDEVQWADDEERGSAWTRLLLGGEYRQILLLGALDALPLVDRAFPQAELKVFERKLPAGLRRRADAAVAHAGHRRGRVQPPCRARARRRGEPASSGEGGGALRRDAPRPLGARRSTASSPGPRKCASRPTCSGTG